MKKEHHSKPDLKSGADQLDVGLAAIIVEVLDRNKAEEIVRLPLEESSLMADEMIVASGFSARHVRALSDYVLDSLKDNKVKNAAVEGQELADWILIDAGDVIVHLFQPEIRSLYNLEKLWGPVQNMDKAQSIDKDL